MTEEKKVENIRVAVRCRPFNQREIKEQSISCFECKNGNAVLKNVNNPGEEHNFAFDYVYDMKTLQSQVYHDIGQPILDRAFDGYNGTIFAYGQTGSGKTFSMSGVPTSEDLIGLIPRMNQAMFQRIEEEKQKNANKSFLVECSFFEIYNEIIYDLLDSNSKSSKKNKGLEIKEHGVLGIYVKGLQERVVENHEQVLELMALGQQSRTVGSTQMNAESSRSHSIFIIKIHQKDVEDESKNVFAKINLVDLAGSERAASTGASGDRLKEGANINKSLSALGNVINALVEVARSGKKVFIPYRNSKLTRVLQESLGGNSLCSMLATLSPANINYTETLSTLKYANRAKSITVNAKKNEESSQIGKLNEEIAMLKQKLLEQTSSGIDPAEKTEIIAQYEKQIQEVEAIRMQTWEDKVKLSRRHEMERKKLAKEKAAADKRIQEEKTKKWKMLAEKGDVELALRACRDISINCTPWIELAMLIKGRENDSKEHRNLVTVFKTSFDKDIENWKQDSQDPSSEHFLICQCLSKIKNIKEESTVMMKLEAEALSNMSSLIQGIQEAKENLGSTISHEDLLSKQEKLLRAEQLEALQLTLGLAINHRNEFYEHILKERDRIFEIHIASKKMIHNLQSITADPLNSSVADAIDQLQAQQLQTPDKQTNEIQSEFVVSNDTVSVGLEDGGLSDGYITASSNTELAKQGRLNFNGGWYAAEGDESPFIQFQLRHPFRITQMAIQGIEVINTTDVLELNKTTAAALLEKYSRLVEWEPTTVYDAIGHLISWKNLLKTTKVPHKLLNRPPVRFIHDIISKVIESTTYAAELFTAEERDYNNLETKEKRMDYLTKILNHVKTSVPEKELNTNPADIVAGKEVSNTLSFLGLLAIAALQHSVESLPEAPPTESKLSASWITEFQLESSIDGTNWTKSPNFTGANDPQTVSHVQLPGNIDAKFVRILPINWEGVAGGRFEILGNKLIEQDTIGNKITQQANSYTEVLCCLTNAMEIVLGNVKARLKQAQENQKQSEVQVEELMRQIEVLNEKNKALILEVTTSQETLKASSLQHEKLEARNKQLELKVETLESSITETESTNQTQKEELQLLQQQHSKVVQSNEELTSLKLEMQNSVDSLIKSKEDLEKLNNGLRQQLIDNTEENGETASRAATLEAEIMSNKVEIEEIKRTLAQSESKCNGLDSAKKALEAEKESLLGTEAELRKEMETMKKQLVENRNDTERLKLDLENENYQRAIALSGKPNWRRHCK